ncbi:NAD-dependent protein deacetylase hst4 [Lachnellula suecica]|uniref:NAD-dependent protein deacetylase hst4 n=1 Tax=Lachnellula suecica TaxID=602035 RepID=A0A8T9C056_9HELO|nr:NAD-dependent protein deacetylase hst4 [Lachnellula suecica]
MSSSASQCSSPLSSPLSSVASRSPSPPADYPSPPSSNVSDKGGSSPVRDTAKNAQDRDGPPPAKRRKVAAHKELKTEYLDLRALNDSVDETHHIIQDAKLRKLMETLRSKRKIVVIAGAGISVSSGIPDFRSSTGLFTTLKSQHKLKASGKQLFDASVYKNDSSTSSFHDMVRELAHQTQNAKPSPFHHMLATLAEEGRLLRLYSQNVDGIDTSLEPLATKVPLNLKGPWPKTIQLHGGLKKMVCQKCGNLSDFDGALFEGPEPPPCQECEEADCARMAAGLRSHGVGRLRPRMVLYNEFNPDGEAIGAVSHADIKSRPDAVIVVGTSLKVPGVRRLAREICAVTRDRRGGFTAWINTDPEPVGADMKDCWDMVVRADCDEIAHHVGLPRWDDKDCGDYRMVQKEEAKVIKKAKGLVGVILPSKPFAAIKNEDGILTPTDSPRHQSPQPPAKMKQLPLPFASAKPAAAGKESKPKKKANRKPLPAAKPKNKITNSFANTKTSKPTISKTSATKPDILFPNILMAKEKPQLSKAPPRTPLRVASPSSFSSDSDLTPPPSSIPEVVIPYNRHETISPPQIPSNMAHLID